MKHIIILLALVFSMASVNAQTTNAEAQANSPEQDLERGHDTLFDLYKKLAEQGDAEAQAKLAYMYLDGQGVTKDSKLAFEWLEKSAKQGNSDVQFNLGILYSNGQGVAQNHEQFFYWNKKAADQGHAIAQLNLSKMYEKGNGVEQNYILALKWYIIAVTTGSYQAKDNGKFLTTKMSLRQVNEAIDKAKTCLTSNYKDCN